MDGARRNAEEDDRLEEQRFRIFSDHRGRCFSRRRDLEQVAAERGAGGEDPGCAERRGRIAGGGKVALSWTLSERPTRSSGAGIRMRKSAETGKCFIKIADSSIKDVLRMADDRFFRKKKREKNVDIRTSTFIYIILYYIVKVSFFLFMWKTHCKSFPCTTSCPFAAGKRA